MLCEVRTFSVGCLYIVCKWCYVKYVDFLSVVCTLRVGFVYIVCRALAEDTAGFHLTHYCVQLLLPLAR